MNKDDWNKRMIEAAKQMRFGIEKLADADPSKTHHGVSCVPFIYCFEDRGGMQENDLPFIKETLAGLENREIDGRKIQALDVIWKNEPPKHGEELYTCGKFYTIAYSFDTEPT